MLLGINKGSFSIARCTGSVTVKCLILPMDQWLPDYSANNVTSLKLDQQQLFDISRELYAPVLAKWTTERCSNGLNMEGSIKR